jgi:hypothetical protein
MTARTGLRLLFTFILVSLAAYTSWASTQQPVWAWQGLVTAPDRWWTIATLVDAYYGFLTFYVWVFYKETRALPRLGWFLAIMGLGNMAMAAYVLRELGRLRDGEPVEALLLRRQRPPAARALPT